MLINVQYQFHTLSQILNQNDNNELIKNLSHILDQINNSNIYFIISVKTNFLHKWNWIMLINVQYQFHTLSQILNQNDNNVLIKNLSHILDRINKLVTFIL